ncbi:hypothetical protein [Amycolatopsis sp. NPDC004378]
MPETGGRSCAGAEKIASEGKDTDPQVSARERLAELIVSARWSGAPLHPAEALCDHCRGARAAADRMLAEGWTRMVGEQWAYRLADVANAVAVPASEATARKQAELDPDTTEVVRRPVGEWEVVTRA